MGGGEQSNPAQDSWQQYQQQQTYKDLGNSLSQGFQRAGASVAGANSGLSGQVAQAPAAGTYGQPQQQTGPGTGATGPLFAQQVGAGGIDQQKLAQILQMLGYSG
jgi:hypothetical protein